MSETAGMNTTDNSSIEDRRSAIEIAELRGHISDSLNRLSPERLQVLADFADYLANAESEAATQELLAIPGLLDRVRENQATPQHLYTNWRTIRSDV